MKAMTQDRYGSSSVLRLDEVATPAPGADEVLVRVRAAGIGPEVWHLMTGRPYLVRLMGVGVRAPKQRVPGRDLAGTVEAVGSATTAFQPGDEVFGSGRGTLAEYACAGAADVAKIGGAGVLAPKPANLTFEQAAAVATSGTTALQSLRDAGGVRAGQSVLIIGASGGEGGGRLTGGLERQLGALVLSRFVSQRLVPLMAADRRVDLLFLKDVIEDGKLTPVIDRTFALGDAAQALTDAEEGHGSGKKVIMV